MMEMMTSTPRIDLIFFLQVEEAAESLNRRQAGCNGLSLGGAPIDSGCRDSKPCCSSGTPIVTDGLVARWGGAKV